MKIDLKPMIALTGLAGLLCLAAGCGNDHPAPPVERGALVLRFFNSMDNNDASSASAQGGKLMEMDIGNDYLERLIAIQGKNAFLQRVQPEINAGRLDAALEILNEGVTQYPANADLRQLRMQVRDLRKVELLLHDMRIARNSSTMTSAHAKALPELKPFMTPVLQEFLDSYQRSIADKAREEAERAAALERAAAEPVLPPVKVAEPVLPAAEEGSPAGSRGPQANGTGTPTVVQSAVSANVEADANPVESDSVE